jgi:hypothetical protein
LGAAAAASIVEALGVLKYNRACIRARSPTPMKRSSLSRFDPTLVDHGKAGASPRKMDAMEQEFVLAAESASRRGVR